ncbi:hypothetical protein K7432_006624 [Basidiobolus ranarum]|uniref:AB hydrolase-1 domain-containing protein n=1 Tax=Basidiobolus ranarum TaxID=34480 RepID=A0ABR2W1C0_9FUNG
MALLANFRVYRSLQAIPTFGISRSFSTSKRNNVPVQLESLHFKPEISSNTRAIPTVLIVHGLLGAKENWRAIGKMLSKQLQTDVHSLDLRNHGSSPHITEMTYSAMAQDLIEFIEKKNLKEVALVGHSMGGRVAMTTAFNYKSKISSLVLVDVAPNSPSVIDTFRKYIESMKRAEEKGVDSLSSANDILKESCSVESIRQFLLTNLKRDHSTGKYSFRIPLDILLSNLETLKQFHPVVGKENFTKPTLCIAGSRSNYVKPDQYEVIRQYFPNIEFEVVDTGHWVQAESPREFVRILTKFLNEQYIN